MRRSRGLCLAVVRSCSSNLSHFFLLRIRKEVTRGHHQLNPRVLNILSTFTGVLSSVVQRSTRREAFY